MKDRDIVYDWYNAYFRVEFELQTLEDSNNVTADTESAPVNGSSIKSLVEYSDDFVRTVAQDEFWYLDTDNTAMTAAAVMNEGIRARRLLSHGNDTKVQTVTPLNRFFFFEELSDRLLPPMRLLFGIVLEEDSKMIFQNDGTGRRIVITKIQLWVPKLMLTPEGQKLVNKQFLRPTKWRYLKETLAPSSNRRDAGGQWQITPGVKDAKHIFAFFQQAEKNLSLCHNPYKFDTFNLNNADPLQRNCPLAAFKMAVVISPNWIMNAATERGSTAT